MSGPSSINIDRVSRIINAALEVFSERTFDDAGTDEIARRAHVSKRDIYANFPDKHALLSAVIKTVLQADDENFSNVISHTADSVALPERLEVIGLALINEVLSPATCFVARLISSESIKQPQIGAIYFDGWYVRRCEAISKVLSLHIASRKSRVRKVADTNQAARHYAALVVHLPQLTATVGLREIWNPKKVQTHVGEAVNCFLAAYPSLA